MAMPWVRPRKLLTCKGVSLVQAGRTTHGVARERVCHVDRYQAAEPQADGQAVQGGGQGRPVCGRHPLRESPPGLPETQLVEYRLGGLSLLSAIVRLLILD